MFNQMFCKKSKVSSLFICISIILVITLLFAGCSKKNENNSQKEEVIEKVNKESMEELKSNKNIEKQKVKYEFSKETKDYSVNNQTNDNNQSDEQKEEAKNDDTKKDIEYDLNVNNIESHNENEDYETKKNDEPNNYEGIEYIRPHKLSQVINYDIDSDNMQEMIMIKQSIEDDRFKTIIRIDDKELILECDLEIVEYGLVKLDSLNHVTLYVSYDTGSCDYETNFYQYFEKEILYVGTTEGCLGMGSIEIQSDGYVIAETRANIVQTWWYDKPYILADGLLQEMPQLFYNVSGEEFSTKANTLVDYDFFTKPDRNAKRITVPKGTLMIFDMLDDDSWVMVSYVTQNGKINYVYFYVENFMDIEGNENFPVTELFDNICLVD